MRYISNPTRLAFGSTEEMIQIIMTGKKNNRDIVFSVRVSQEEHETIKAIAETCSLPPSTLMRMLALNLRVSSKLDLEVVRQFKKAQADFGRTTGLLKMLLSNPEKYKEEHQYSIEALIKKIDKDRQALNGKIVRVLEAIR